jgi:NTE family protein
VVSVTQFAGSAAQMKVGLVLGAGGSLGASWLMGALDALEFETGWSASDADRIAGTSAGAVIGALLAAGIEPASMSAYNAGKSLEAFAEVEQRVELMAERVSGMELRLQPALPKLGPGSWRLAVSTLVRPRRHAPSTVLAGWLPRGVISTAPISRLIETFVAGDWPDHPAFWAVAADYRTGRRVAFGREDAPPATIGEAVAASCAIPGFYHPPCIAGRRYVDGGVCSLSNLDLVAGRDLDLAVCLNPTSSLAEAMGGTPAERVGDAMRGLSARRLGTEAATLRAEGTEVLLVQPTQDDVAGMGLNLMARGRRVEVLERARRTTALALRDLRGTEQLMPPRTRRARPARRSTRPARRRAA